MAKKSIKKSKRSAARRSLRDVVRRRVVAISMAGVENTQATQCNYITTALCNDGTMWIQRSVENDWHELEPIPQPYNK